VTLTGESLEVKGTIFWLVVSGLIEVAAFLYGLAFTPGYYATNTGLTYGVGGVALAVIYFALVYPCFRQKRWGFVASIIVSVFVVVGTLGLDRLTAPAPLEDVLVALIGILTTYFSYIGYLKIRPVV
jgi:uncharacterized membrane protein (UPF0136 family)